jgi:hypothetical protein
LSFISGIKKKKLSLGLDNFYDKNLRVKTKPELRQFFFGAKPALFDFLAKEMLSFDAMPLYLVSVRKIKNYKRLEFVLFFYYITLVQTCKLLYS